MDFKSAEACAADIRREKGLLEASFVEMRRSLVAALQTNRDLLSQMRGEAPASGNTAFNDPKLPH